eukprot:scaffold295551_cov18-Tisochrysis_lutea.AAC.1
MNTTRQPPFIIIMCAMKVPKQLHQEQRNLSKVDCLKVGNKREQDTNAGMRSTPQCRESPWQLLLNYQLPKVGH